ncbi:MAG TPA: hydrogen peroxide-inducible genes activator [Burkholderiales bacterium]|nr:hydrogen peroxide-inducible genes activator [Burkholderiales bacterium]
MKRSEPGVSALPSLRQLQYLAALAERRNFRQAAEACFVTQSTLSAGIKELEATLGTQLVERTTRATRLTAAGEEVVARARAIIAATEDLARFAKGVREPFSGPLRLGVIPTIAPFLLPAVLPALRKRYPALKLFLREDLTANLLERLRSATLDLALIALPYDTGELEVQPLFKDVFWYVAREDDPLAAAKTIAVRQLKPETVLLLEEGHCLRDHAIQACGRREASAMLEATSLTTLLQMVEGGMGVTLLPEMTLRSGILNGTGLVARPFATEVPSRTIALAMRREGSFRREARLFAEQVVQCLHAQQKRSVGGERRSRAGTA